jgi:hypothetical protein
VREGCGGEEGEEDEHLNDREDFSINLSRASREPRERIRHIDGIIMLA